MVSLIIPAKYLYPASNGMFVDLSEKFQHKVSYRIMKYFNCAGEFPAINNIVQKLRFFKLKVNITSQRSGQQLLVMQIKRIQYQPFEPFASPRTLIIIPLMVCNKYLETLAPRSSSELY